MSTDHIVEVPDRLYDVIRPHLRFAEGTDMSPESDLRSLGLDSMQAIELLFAIEDEFDRSIDDALMTDETFRTPGSLWAAMRASEKGAA